ncbi:MAG TPA: PKD domain-containing protein [Chloroflexi bacterium]|nr:PKD domain-containing protein [Chloroflexota bacterium]
MTNSTRRTSPPRPRPPPTESSSTSVVAPTARIYVFLRGKDGLTFGFDGSQSAASDGKIVACEWNFGDGSAGSGDKIIYTCAQAGTHTVTLTVYDDKGQRGDNYGECPVVSPLR